jgi:hypothetical protein
MTVFELTSQEIFVAFTPLLAGVDQDGGIALRSGETRLVDAPVNDIMLL